MTCGWDLKEYKHLSENVLLTLILRLPGPEVQFIPAGPGLTRLMGFWTGI